MPASNRTYFCDANTNNCYSLVRLGSSDFTVAKEYCEVLGGGLVSYSSREKQLLVERWARVAMEAGGGQRLRGVAAASARERRRRWWMAG